MQPGSSRHRSVNDLKILNASPLFWGGIAIVTVA